MKSQDVMIASLVALHPEQAWTYPEVARRSGLSQSAAFRAVQRLRTAGLVVPDGFRVFDQRFLNFLEHGVPYAFPAALGKVVRGLPTAHAAPPLSQSIAASSVVVWPYPKGTVRGESVTPLAPSAPEAAQRDEQLYRLLALIDALRIGRPREQKLAIQLIKDVLVNARLLSPAG